VPIDVLNAYPRAPAGPDLVAYVNTVTLSLDNW
jgi:hypothetical protein